MGFSGRATFLLSLRMMKKFRIAIPVLLAGCSLVEPSTVPGPSRSPATQSAPAPRTADSGAKKPSSKASTPRLVDASTLNRQALALVNEARSKPRRCGRIQYAAAAPLTLSSALEGAAREHAREMARKNFLEHEGLDGSTPARRVEAQGYQHRLVGENIAGGTMTVKEVVAGWLASPDHCENIMEPRFTEMGIAQATGAKSRFGMYWAQVLGAPR